MPLLQMKYPSFVDSVGCVAGGGTESSDKEEIRGDGAAAASHEQVSKAQKNTATATAKTTKRKATASSKQPPSSASKRKKADVTPGKQRTIASFFRSAASSKLADGDSTQALLGAKQVADLQSKPTPQQPKEEADRSAGRQGQDDVVSLVDEDGEGEAGAEVKTEPEQDPGEAPQKPRRLGAFATASAPSVGVSNALIEKRRAGQRKAAGEQPSGVAEGAAAGSAVKREAEEAVTWPEGTPAPYLVIARAFAAMESTTKRLAKDNIMVEMFRGILRCSPGVHITMITFKFLLWQG